MMKSLKISLKEKQDLLEQVLRLQPENGHQVRELEGKNY
jgi:acetolactate synthase regulatory subunit